MSKHYRDLCPTVMANFFPDESKVTLELFIQFSFQFDSMVIVFFRGSGGRALHLRGGLV